MTSKTCGRRIVLVVVLATAVAAVVGTRWYAGREAPNETPYPVVVAADAPLAYWQLGATVGQVAVDTVSSQRASYEGAPVRDAAGPISAVHDTALSLRGGTSGDSIQSIASSYFDLSQGTLELWFQAGDVRTNQKLLTVARGAAGTGKFILGLIDGHLYNEVSTAHGAHFVTGAGQLQTGRWYYAVATYDPAARRLRSYLNGRLVSTIVTDGTPIVHTGAAFVTIGGWAGVGFWFHGSVAEAALYRTVLSPTQISRHFAAATFRSPNWNTVSTGLISSRYIFGTLHSDPAHSSLERRAGLGAVELELGWDSYEPSDGVFSDPTAPNSYAYQCRTTLRAFLAAGMKVVLSVGLQYPPAWVFSYPNSMYVNQDGVRAPVAVNLTFNRILRIKAEEYIARLNRDLGLNHMWAIRVGSGPESEVLFPAETAGDTQNSYWAFDDTAQGSGDGLPATSASNPFPGWKPGQQTYRGLRFTTMQVAIWMNWYLNALMDGVNWQIHYYRELGYSGYIHLPMPGWGTRPTDYADAVNHYLDGSADSLQTLGRGAAWAIDIALLRYRAGVVLDISSVGDASSIGKYSSQSSCKAGDTAVSTTDPRILQWSSVRWLSYNARRAGLAVIGETPARGPQTANILAGQPLLLRAVDLMVACNMQGLLWAFDDDLYTGMGAPSLADYANIAAHASR